MALTEVEPYAMRSGAGSARARSDVVKVEEKSGLGPDFSSSWSVVVPVVAVLLVDPWGQRPYGPARVHLVAALVLVLAAVVAWRPSTRVLPASVGRAWVALLAAVGVATAAAPARLPALVGTAERRFGMLTWVVCGVACWAGARLDDRGRRSLVGGSVVAACGVGGWAVLEAFGWEPIERAGATDRLVGSMGSSAFLGSAVALLLPAAVGVVLDGGWAQRWRVAAGVGAGLCTVALVGSGARAAWVGVVAAAVVAGWRVRASVRRRLLPAAGVAALGLVVVVGLVAALGTGGRVTHAFDAKAGGAPGRLDEWRVAAHTIRAHPLVGVGSEGSRIAFGRSVDDAYERAHGRTPLPDRAHSAVLDLAVTTGVLGLAAGVALAVACALALRRVLRGATPAVVGVVLGLVAYGVQQLLLFPLADVDPLAWLLAGSVLGVAATPRRAPVAAGPIAVLAAVAVALAGATEVAADHALHRADVARSRGDAAGAERSLDASLGRRPDLVPLRLAAADAAAAGPSRVDLVRAIDQLAAGLRWSPKDPLLLRRRAELEVALAGRTGLPSDAEAAARSLRRVVTADPRNAALLTLLGVSEARVGRVEAARAAWTRAAELAPRDVAPVLDLALEAEASGDFAAARRWSAEATRRAPGADEVVALAERLGAAP